MKGTVVAHHTLTENRDRDEILKKMGWSIYQGRVHCFLLKCRENKVTQINEGMNITFRKPMITAFSINGNLASANDKITS